MLLILNLRIVVRTGYSVLHMIIRVSTLLSLMALTTVRRNSLPTIVSHSSVLELQAGWCLKSLSWRNWRRRKLWICSRSVALLVRLVMITPVLVGLIWQYGKSWIVVMDTRWDFKITLIVHLLAIKRLLSQCLIFVGQPYWRKTLVLTMHS